MKVKILTILGMMGMAFTLIQASDQPKMNGKLKVSMLTPSDACYTGKPYSKSLGAYLFNWRNYDPQTNRWISPDPCGFPDGANNYIYAPNGTSQFDRSGLFTLSVTNDSPSHTVGYDTTGKAFSVSAFALKHIDPPAVGALPTFTGWTITPGAAYGNDLTLTVNTYNVTANSFHGVGNLDLKFDGTGVQTGWMQLVTTNDDKDTHKSVVNKWDVGPGASSPAYPGLSSSGANATFTDGPPRNFSDIKQYKLGGGIVWTASLYLIDIDDFNNTITVHDGVSWGFSIIE